MNGIARAGILGASGYTGQELVRLLAQHPGVSIAGLFSASHAGKKYSDVFPSFRSIVDQEFKSFDVQSCDLESFDVLFTALPHAEAARRITVDMLEKVRVVDLSGDFRLKDSSQYPVWYGFDHPNKDSLGEAVFGLSEWRRDEIKGARLVANPGCYATCAMLCLLPLVSAGLVAGTPVVDAKSGVSGAGRAPSTEILYSECNENLKAYKVAAHRHTPEIEQELCLAGKAPVQILFTPHLVPMTRGILTTTYCRLERSITREDLNQIFQSRYSAEPFVHILPEASPETRWVRGTNNCSIAVTLDERTGLAVVIGAIDNLVKGAAGQAIQNMNIMVGFEETLGLRHLAPLP